MAFALRFVRSSNTNVNYRRSQPNYNVTQMKTTTLSLPIYRSPVATLQQRFFAIGGEFDDREKAFENLAVNKHDQDLLDKLRKAEEGKNRAEQRVRVQLNRFTYFGRSNEMAY